jgi:DNA-binding transcriptional MocR family regulator
MTIDWQSKYSDRVNGLYGSMTRQLMQVMGDPEIISFGGGLPAWDLFPVDQIRQVTDELLRDDGPATLQYGTSEGYGPLRELLTERYRKRGFDITVDNVMIATGSIQGVDLMGKLFLEKGDAVVVGDPTFLTALQAFSFYRVNFPAVPLDKDGMQIDELPALLERTNAKFIYVMPTFQNPTGRTLGLERRRRLVEIADRYGLPIVEDDPYCELRYDGEDIPPLKVLSTGDNVIYLGSFSKTLSPGMRVGFVMAPAAIMEKLVWAKQAADLHTSALPQRIIHEFLRREFLDPHIQTLIANYRRRRDTMIEAMEFFFPSDVCWDRPDGGIFLWVTLPLEFDTQQMFDDAVTEKVVFVPGSCYSPDGGLRNTMRLNFSANTEEKITQGIERLARVIRRNL